MHPGQSVKAQDLKTCGRLEEYKLTGQGSFDRVPSSPRETGINSPRGMHHLIIQGITSDTSGSESGGETGSGDNQKENPKPKDQNLKYRKY
jgi:hypothetical protein